MANDLGWKISKGFRPFHYRERPRNAWGVRVHITPLPHKRLPLLIKTFQDVGEMHVSAGNWGQLCCSNGL